MMDDAESKSPRVHETSAESSFDEPALFDPNVGVKRGLRNEHISMMAIAGIIGSGIIVGTGQALVKGGPAALIIGFGSIGLVAAAVMQSIGEMAIFPDGGGFLEHCSRFGNRPFGATVSINYFLCFAMVLASEYSALMSVFTPVEGGDGSWNPDNKIPQYAVMLLFWGGFTAFQAVGVTAFGWSEYFLAWLKLIGLVAYFIFAIVYVAGGVKNRPAFGFHYWNDPGAFSNGFKGVARVFIFCSTFYAGAEGVAVAASESRNPGKAIPQATKTTLVRILFVYMGTALFIGMTCPWDAEQLQEGKSNSLLSPLTIGIQLAGWHNGFHLINAFLVMILLSGINASIYLCTRTVLYMANRGDLPRFFAWTDKRGVPYPAMIFSNAFGFLSLMNINEGSASAYNYIINVSGVCIFIVWGSTSLMHLRFRRAWKVQGHSPSELHYRSWLYPVIPLASFIANVFLLLVQGWTVFVPFDYKSFIDSYIMIPASLVFYGIYALMYKEPFFKRASQIDLVSGRRRDLDYSEDKGWLTKIRERLQKTESDKKSPD